ncbi:MAG TPA: efflux RND transporter periplasmic adaptor subunit [Pirellulales bacterium]|nr:efflux RND transporter periplasmic adaptor subunit [Pirellulales bacterium]
MKKPLLIVAAALLLGLAIAGAWFYRAELAALWKSSNSPVANNTADAFHAGATAYIERTPKEIELNGMRTAAATAPTRPRTLTLRGNLQIDPARLVHVHPRFSGQIVELAMKEERNPWNPQGPPRRRPVGFMDDVETGQMMAVVLSRELGEKKSELIDAQIRLWTDEKILERYRDAYRRSAMTERDMFEQTRLVDVGRTAVRKARNTLRAWLLTRDEVEAVVEESKRIYQGDATYDGTDQDEWARVVVPAAITGTIVERNVTMGEIVDPNDDLYKLADLTELSAWLHVYEEDIPYLRSMPKPIPWKLRLNSNPAAGEIPGFLDEIGDLIDSNEHMALAFGHVPNPEGKFTAGQFINATIELPPEAGVVEIPTRALVEDGEQSVVLVQDPSHPTRFASRRLSVVRRYHDRVYVRSILTEEQKQQGLEELREGERVVSAGALELKEALQQQQRAGRQSARQ